MQKSFAKPKLPAVYDSTPFGLILTYLRNRSFQFWFADRNYNDNDFRFWLNFDFDLLQLKPMVKAAQEHYPVMRDRDMLDAFERAYWNGEINHATKYKGVSPFVSRMANQVIADYAGEWLIPLLLQYDNGLEIRFVNDFDIWSLSLVKIAGVLMKWSTLKQQEKSVKEHLVRRLYNVLWQADEALRTRPPHTFLQKTLVDVLMRGCVSNFTTDPDTRQERIEDAYNSARLVELLYENNKRCLNKSIEMPVNDLPERRVPRRRLLF